MTGLIIAILKGIGWVLLLLLLLLLLILGLVLFVPVRYRADGSWLGRPKGRVRITWLFGCVSAGLEYGEQGLASRIRLFGISVGKQGETSEPPGTENGGVQEAEAPKSPKPAAGEVQAEAKETQRTSAAGAPEPEAKETQRTSAAGVSETETCKTRRTETADGQKNTGTIGGKETAKVQTEPARKTEGNGKTAAGEIPERSETGDLEERTEKKTQDEKPFFFLRIWKCWRQKLLKLWDSLKRTRDRCLRFLRTWKANASYYIEVLQREESRLAISNAAAQLAKILRHAGPGKWRLRIAAGTGEADTTGMLLAVQGLLYPLTMDNLVIEPDFENQKLEADFYAAGRIRLFYLLLCTLRVVCDRKLWELIRLMKREETGNGRKK